MVLGLSHLPSPTTNDTVVPLLPFASKNRFRVFAVKKLGLFQRVTQIARIGLICLSAETNFFNRAVVDLFTIRHGVLDVDRAKE